MSKELRLDDQDGNNFDEKRAARRYTVESRMSLAVEDAQRGEPVGLGVAGDVSTGGVRLRHLPADARLRVGDYLRLLLIGEDRVLSLRGEVVHHSAREDLGVKFLDVTAYKRRRIEDFLHKLYVH